MNPLRFMCASLGRRNTKLLDCGLKVSPSPLKYEPRFGSMMRSGNVNHPRIDDEQSLSLSRESCSQRWKLVVLFMCADSHTTELKASHAKNIEQFKDSTECRTYYGAIAGAV
jgi:hypothetical protein